MTTTQQHAPLLDNATPYEATFLEEESRALSDTLSQLHGVQQRLWAMKRSDEQDDTVYAPCVALRRKEYNAAFGLLEAVDAVCAVLLERWVVIEGDDE